MKKMFMTAVMVLALCVGSQAAFAAAVSGDIVGLWDVNAPSQIRPNTYTDDINGGGGSYVMNIGLLVDDGSCTPVPAGFPTEKDALSVTWSQNTPGMGNGYIDTDTYTAIPAPVGGYYLSVDAYNIVQNLGPDSWRATYAPSATEAYSGDFSFVATDYSAQDTGQVSDIRIEFYNGNPTTIAPIAAGIFGSVSGGDDYNTADIGRSWPTPLDSVAHSTLPPNIITTYDKTPYTQTLWDIEDLNGVTYAPEDECEAWLYAVYYPDPDIKGKYNRDPISEIVGYDDYVLEEGALVIFAIGDYYDWKEYPSYFPDVIYR